MNSRLLYWLKITAFVSGLAILMIFAPKTPIDPWNLISIQKTATMILVLVILQIFGSLASQYLGLRGGAVVTGFFGGLISSTATTASLARRSKLSKEHSTTQILTFLSAIGAMLLEGIAIAAMGTAEFHLSNFLIFIGPMIVTIVMIFLQYKIHSDTNLQSEEAPFRILTIIKMALFIVAILSVSKLSQNLFGKNSLLMWTFLVSLFEIHGSLIASVQLHESGNLSDNFLCALFAVSIISSCLSKLFLIYTLASRELKIQAIRVTIVLIGSVVISWIVAIQ